ncbi:MAG: hypothetical protein V3V01_08740 [Acidimicrobiales bacterium]
MIAISIAIIAVVTLILDDGDDLVGPELAETELVDISLESQRELAAEFLQDWKRFRTEEFLAESIMTRTRPDGERLEVRQILAQRPGDRLLRGLSGIDGYLGGVAVFCTGTSATVEGDPTKACRDLEGAPGIDEALQTELETLAALVVGEVPVYRLLRTEEACWELLLTTETLDAPYGERTVMCFDPDTGVMRSSTTAFGNDLLEEVETVNVRLEVTDADLRAVLGV